MGHPGGELAKRGEFLLGDDLFLRRFEMFQGLLKGVVLCVQLFGQLLDQIQPLHFQGVAPEHFQGTGHIGHFVITLDLDRHLQVAASHGTHGRGQPDQAADHITSHK